MSRVENGLAQRRTPAGGGRRQQAFAAAPDGADLPVLADIAELLVHPLGGQAQGELAQRREVALLEEIVGGDGGAVAQIDLAFRQPLPELPGRDIHQLDLIGGLDHRVGHGLAHGHAGDLADGVGAAFEVLDIERGENVDAGRPKFLDILPAFDMARAGGVGMGEFVHDGEAGAAREHGLQIQFPQLRAAVGDQLAGNNGQPFKQKLGFLASVGLGERDHHVHPLGVSLARRLQHGVGLAHAGRHAEEYLQPAAGLLCLGAADGGEKCVGVGAGRVGHRA